MCVGYACSGPRCVEQGLKDCLGGAGFPREKPGALAHSHMLRTSAACKGGADVSHGPLGTREAASRGEFNNLNEDESPVNEQAHHANVKAA